VLVVVVVPGVVSAGEVVAVEEVPAVSAG